MKHGNKKESYMLQYSGNLLGEAESLKLNRNINLLINNGIRDLILDVSNLELINTPGVLFLADMFYLFKELHGSFLISNPQNQIRDLIGLMKLKSIII